MPTHSLSGSPAGAAAPASASPLAALSPELRTALIRTRYDADTLLDVLGADVHTALGRSEPVAVRRAVRGTGDLGTLARLFLLGDPLSEREVAAALDPVDLDRAVAAGLCERDGDEVRAALDLRPLDLGDGPRWVLSDLDDGMRRRTLSGLRSRASIFVPHHGQRWICSTVSR